MELALVPLCALLLIVALIVVTAGKARVLSHPDPCGGRRTRRRRDPSWRARRGVLMKARQRRRIRGGTIVIPPGAAGRPRD
jgi:hypothetical protein